MSSLGKDTEVKFVPFTVSGNPPLQGKTENLEIGQRTQI